MTPGEAIKLAARVAARGCEARTYRLGAVAVRSDGAVVASPNKNTEKPNVHAHAEASVLRKAGLGAEVVYVVRITRDGGLAVSKPCSACELLMRHKRVKRVVYVDEAACLREMRL